jgi:hypothetical protein
MVRCRWNEVFEVIELTPVTRPQQTVSNHQRLFDGVTAATKTFLATRLEVQ